MNSTFPGFPTEALKFLRALKRNNDREWFQPRKAEFEKVLRDPMLALLERINGHLIKFAPDYCTEPAKAIFRIYRDTRFSKDKTPYKTHVAAVFSHRMLPRNAGAGFYFQVSTEKAGMGGGIHMPPADELKKLRVHMVENFDRYQKTMRRVQASKIAGEFFGHAMSRVPKGFDCEDPAAELLKCRSFFYYTDLEPEVMLTPGFEKELASRFRAVAPFVHLLDEAFVGTKSRVLSEPRL
jgi:uncharacterized protein (TIGR02453 family)